MPVFLHALSVIALFLFTWPGAKGDVAESPATCLELSIVSRLRALFALYSLSLEPEILEMSVFRIRKQVLPWRRV